MCTKYNNTTESLKINYDDFSQLVKQSRFDTDKPIIETKNKYDGSGRLINISHVGNQKTYADYDITWDNGNRITDFDFTYLNGPAKKNQSNYRYNKTSQLTSATYNFMQDERYNFDKNGNRIKAEIQDQKRTYKTAEYNRLISDNESEYKYDLEGNRISKISKDGSIIKYHWDNRNRLAKIDTPKGSIEYIYDHQNRIVLRKQGENTITFIHDSWQIVLQFDNDKLTHRYLWGTKQDELICDNDNWTLSDHLNTIRDIVKSDGTVTDHLEYNSFGKIISATKNDSSLQFAYTGKLTDKVSELQWNINRWYDAKVGRWVSEDPIGFGGDDVNVVRYANNSSINNIDADGLELCTLMFHMPPGPWTMYVSGLQVSVGVGTNPGTANGQPATNLYCFRGRTWSLAYRCPGTWFRCSAVISRTVKEYQNLTVAVPSDTIIYLGSFTFPLPSPLPIGPGITLTGFLDTDDAKNALNVCNDPTWASFPASTYTPPSTYYR
jgi:RHS repeat-associated protein